MWHPSRWASLAPNGLGHQKPNHYLEMARVAWENRDQIPFAWRILRDGVCDGCALGTSGMTDWTLPGVHLCMVRLELLRLNTAPALDPGRLADVRSLRGLKSRELRALGRLPEPMVWRRGEAGYRVMTWDEALGLAAHHIREADPTRIAIYLTSRGITNEVYYVAQRAARGLGTNNVDNSARLCHAASTSAMTSTLGLGASTCSYRDWMEADLIVFFGSNTPNNQPVTMKYLHYAKRQGALVAVVNTFREPGLERYWVPSVVESAVFGTRLADHWFDVDTGGDLAFLIGVFRALVEGGGVVVDFIDRHTMGFDAARERALDTSWADLERFSGSTRERMQDFARLLEERPNAVFVWSMGLTQHAHGVETIQALINVALARGLFAGPGRGLMPIRGHSGVQGGAEVGCVPGVDPDAARRWSQVWGFDVPEHRGLSAGDMVEASARGQLDVFWMVGGNFLETIADAPRTRSALASPGLRVHQDVTVSSAMLVEPSDVALLLPAATRYESPGGGTETSTERRIIFSPEIPGRRIGSAMPEWWVFDRLLTHLRPGVWRSFADVAAVRSEIAEAIPRYRGIERLGCKGDAIQWGGARLFADGQFETGDGRARFTPLAPVRRKHREGTFLVSTRRGKQFNSMVQRDWDPLTGATRDAVFMNPVDADRLGLAQGTLVRLASSAGDFCGHVHLAQVRAGNLEVHWPEGMPLLSASAVDPVSREPDYNALVTVERMVPEEFPSSPAR